jgi:periplasmic mercuric ion binding protein
MILKFKLKSMVLLTFKNLKMRSKLSALIALLILSVSVTAQIKNDVTKKEVTFIVNMHCSACKEKIEKYIPMERGVKDIKVDLEKKEVTVIYKPNKTNVEKLKKAIEELGYSCKEK